MHRIEANSAGLDITEDNNMITIHGRRHALADLTIQVPAQTSLRLDHPERRQDSGGKLSGEIEAENMNGAVTSDQRFRVGGRQFDERQGYRVAESGDAEQDHELFDA